jgi:hypothetical protein
MFDESSHRRLDELLATNAHIQEIHLVRPSLPGPQRERGGVHEMNKRFNPFDIHVKELSLAGHDRGRSHGPDIGL